jgi:hypothetical protein
MDYGVPLLLILRPKPELWKTLSDGQKTELTSLAKGFCEGPECKVWTNAESVEPEQTVRLYWDRNTDEAMAAFRKARSDKRIRKHFDAFEMKPADE